MLDVKNVLHVDEMTIATNSNQKKGLNLARTCSTLFSIFPYIYVMIFLNFEFAEETLHTDVWTIGNVTLRLKFSEF